MRRIALITLGLLLAGTIPAAALTQPIGVTFRISPVGGTPGTTIFVDGTCHGGDDGWAYLEMPPRSDAIEPPADAQYFTVSNNQFHTTLQNPYGAANGFPTDARVRVQCGFTSASTPFHASNTPTSNSPSIFASLGPTPCGFGFVPEGEDGRMPCPSHVKGFTATGALAQTNFYAGGPQGHGYSVAVGDVDQNGTVDVVTGSGAGETAALTISKLSGEPVYTAYPYGEFTGGINVAVGDVTGDGRNDVVAAAGPGGGPHVIVLSHNFGTKQFDVVGSFYAYAPHFSGGVHVAAGNNEIVAAPGAGGGPHVRRFGVGGNLLGEFMAYAPSFTGGVSVALDRSTGRVVTGAGPGGGPHVALFAPSGAPAGGFYAYDPSFTGGVSVAAGRVGGSPQIVTGAGPGGSPHVRIFNTDGSLKSGGFYAFSDFTAGVRVAVTP